MRPQKRSIFLIALQSYFSYIWTIMSRYHDWFQWISIVSYRGSSSSKLWSNIMFVSIQLNISKHNWLSGKRWAETRDLDMSVRPLLAWRLHERSWSETMIFHLSIELIHLYLSLSNTHVKSSWETIANIGRRRSSIDGLGMTCISVVSFKFELWKDDPKLSSSALAIAFFDMVSTLDISFTSNVQNTVINFLYHINEKNRINRRRFYYFLEIRTKVFETRSKPETILRNCHLESIFEIARMIFLFSLLNWWFYFRFRVTTKPWESWRWVFSSPQQFWHSINVQYSPSLGL